MLRLDAVDMKRIILFTICLLCLVGSTSAYQCLSDVLRSVPVGLPLNCSVDSNFPVGTPFDIVLSVLCIHVNTTESTERYNPGK